METRGQMDQKPLISQPESLLDHIVCLGFLFVYFIFLEAQGCPLSEER